MSCAEEQKHNQSPSKSGERDGNGLVPAGGPLMAVEREADRNKHGEGQWIKS